MALQWPARIVDWHVPTETAVYEQYGILTTSRPEHLAYGPAILACTH